MLTVEAHVRLTVTTALLPWPWLTRQKGVGAMATVWLAPRWGLLGYASQPAFVQLPGEAHCATKVSI